MLNVLVDACVWLDFAQDHKQSPLFGMFEEVLDADQFRLLLPRLVVDEFKRDRDRIAKASEAVYEFAVPPVPAAPTRFVEVPPVDKP